MTHEILDAWAQHPTARHLNHPMFESLRRWTKGGFAATADELPVAATLAAMDEGGVGRSLISAWTGPRGDLIYSECCELGIPFCTQVGHTGPLLPSEYGRPITCAVTVVTKCCSARTGR